MAEEDRPPSSIVHSPPAPDAHPHLLSYDDLPPGSDIRREYHDHGGAGAGGVREVRITIPAGETPPAAIKIALFDSFAAGARSSWAILLMSLLLFTTALRTNRVAGVPLGWAWTFFAIFCGALVLLIAWVRYGLMLEAINVGREQMTVIAVTATRLLIETSGPFGIAGYDFAPAEIGRLTVRHGPVRDDRNRPHRVSHLELTLRDERVIRLIPGRDRRELDWIRTTITQTMQLRR